jgi:hypothetical protein
MAIDHGNGLRPISLVTVLAFSLLLFCGGVGSLYGALAVTDNGTSQADLIRRLNKPQAGSPTMEVRVHKVGNMALTVTNYGIFGNQNDASIKDPETNQVAPSCQFPAGSQIEYLFQGSLWIGAIVGEDTLVSTGHDGWLGVFEMYADAVPKGSMVKRSTRKTDVAYSPDAISEADYIAVYSDTLTDQAFVAISADDGRPHIPLGVQITQKSYSWSYSYAEDFILIDFLIRNIGQSELRKVYIGLYIDADVLHVSNPGGFADDITGFKATVPYSVTCPTFQDTVNVAWIADNDGDPNTAGAVFDFKSPTAVTGTRVVRTPSDDLKTSFNWWVSNGVASMDWGPTLISNYRGLGTGGLGTPAGDKNKYFFMKNNEFDYDQIYSAVNYSDPSLGGWMPPNTQLGTDLANGFDTRYLLSFGPFDIGIGDTLPLTIGYIGGENFHMKPDNFSKNFDANDPIKFYNGLNFSDLGVNAQWAGWVYDNPGVDTDPNDGKGCRPMINPCDSKDTIWSGDNVPDFKGPPPPPPPVLRFSASPGKITVRWNGRESENTVDPFSKLVDFEGYRVYMGDKLQLNEFALLTSYDHKNIDRFKLNVYKTPPVWEKTEIPFTLDSLKAIYEVGDSLNPGKPDFNPLAYTADFPLEWLERGDTSTSIETAKYYFTTQDYNRSELDTVGGTMGTIVKVYPDATPADSVWVDDLGASVPKMYEYEFVVEGMLPSRPVFLAVSAFDFGNPATNLDPLESSPLANAIQVFPVNSSDRVEQEKLSVTVFPNPYKVSGGYQEAGYEDPGLEAQRARRIYFANLPKKATIRIYTLDGDLVRELEHPQVSGTALYAGESMTAWDLISKNTQAVVSGIYLYSVESNMGNQVGKFVIIK